jgi:hypothetical protein
MQDLTSQINALYRDAWEYQLTRAWGINNAGQIVADALSNPKFPLAELGQVLRNAGFRFIGGVVGLGTSEPHPE